MYLEHLGWQPVAIFMAHFTISGIVSREGVGILLNIEKTINYIDLKSDFLFPINILYSYTHGRVLYISFMWMGNIICHVCKEAAVAFLSMLKLL